MSKKTGKEMADELSEFVNSYSTDKQEDFINHFCRQHRTLQQSMFGMLLGVIEKVAQPDYGRDGRNEESHKRAVAIVKGYKVQLKKDLMAQPDGYWTEEKADDYLNGEYKTSIFSNLPFV